MFEKKNIRYLLAIILICSLFSGSCEKGNDASSGGIEIAFSNDLPTFNWNSDGKFLVISTTESWTLSITDSLGVTPNWCSVSTENLSGVGNKNVWITTTYNTSANNRHAIITVAGNKEKATITITQYGTAIPRRMELPKIVDVEWFFEYTDGKFALEYAPSKKHSKWVAWPLYRDCMGSSGRTDYWQWDSRIPSQFSPIRSDFSGYDRGHLCPSADRTYSVTMNRQTFMYSNMSPQISAFNGGIWAELENRTRNWASGTDTLYICAGGTVLQESQIMTYTGAGNLAVPQYYFKVILRKKASTGEYDAIGFWFEHRSYAGTRLSSAQVKTVKQIEELTGIDFFYNLPEPTQSQVESAFNPSAWGINN